MSESHHVVIRPYAAGDAAAFHFLNSQWITTLFQMEASDESALSDPEGTILAPGGEIFVAEQSGGVIGCVALVPLADGSYELAKMAVAPEAQGRGVGRRLMAAAIEWARKRGVKRLFLGSNTRLTPALRLYESAGFQHLPPERRPVSPYARANVFMEMLLEENEKGRV